MSSLTVIENEMSSIWLLILLFFHIFAIKTFTGGFLQKRRPFLDIADASDFAQTSLQTHTRAIILVVDALRFDFVAPHPPDPQSAFQHNVLTLPRGLSHKYPQQSVLFDAFADPPTTTLQRIKAIATGSLPTFVDAGNNLGASSIPDDSLLKQAKMAGKKVAFVGDSTWMSVFPDEFAENQTFAYNGLNVEDLDTVDNGVVEHLFPMMEDKSKPFDLLFAHFLGVDHVGHRVGSDHPRMRAKLLQMQGILERVVELQDEDTLLVVLGDHGMDHSGSHCGDSTMETSSAMWIYSKRHLGPELTSPIPPTLDTNTTFPGSSFSHRSIQQIDILPTLSLLLGLPIPFNNLGTIIPELFPDEQDLQAALETNAAQIDRFLDTYRQGASGRDLDPVWNTLERSRASIRAHRSEHVSDYARPQGGVDQGLTEALAAHTRMALAACRQVWARFDFHKMAAGLAFMTFGILATVYLLQASKGVERSPGSHSWSLTSFLVIAAHACALAVPALTVWEDRIVAVLLHACVLPHIRKALTRAPAPRVHAQSHSHSHSEHRTLLHLCLAFLACIHLASWSTICREEQLSFCRVTFYSTSPGSGTAAPIFALVFSIPASLVLPTIIWKLLVHRIRRASNESKDTRENGGDGAGSASWFLPYIFRPSLVLGNLYWILEWADSGSTFGEAWCPFLRQARTWIARVAFSIMLLGVLGVLYASRKQRAIASTTESKSPSAGAAGRPETRGASEDKGDAAAASMVLRTTSNYLCTFLAVFAFAYIPSQLTGQLVLCLCLAALLLYLEILRMGPKLDQPQPRKGQSARTLTSSDILVLPLLAVLAFYGTGHQATITSLQLKSAFLLHPTVVYPYSRITLVLNSLGSFIFMGFAAPLLAIWICDKSFGWRVQSFRAVVLLIRYTSMILSAGMAGAAMFTGHSLIWKVGAPRYILSTMMLVAIDISAGIGHGLLNWMVAQELKDTR